MRTQAGVDFANNYAAAPRQTIVKVSHLANSSWAQISPFAHNIGFRRGRIKVGYCADPARI